MLNILRCALGWKEGVVRAGRVGNVGNVGGVKAEDIVGAVCAPELLERVGSVGRAIR